MVHFILPLWVILLVLGLSIETVRLKQKQFITRLLSISLLTLPVVVWAQSEDLPALQLESRSQNESIVNPELKIPQNQLQTDNAGRMSLTFHNVSLSYLLNLLAQESGRNIMVHPSAEQNITLSLDQMTLDEILEAILLYANLRKYQKGDLLFIMNEPEYERLAQGGLRTEVITLHYAEAEELLPVLESHLFDGGVPKSYQGSIGADHRLNQLVITDQAGKLEKMKRVIQALDRPAKQVEISAYIVAAFDDFAKELGVNWGLNYAKGDYSIGGNITNGGNFGGNVGSLTSLGVKDPNFSMAYMILGKGLNLGLELSAMQSEGRGEIISNPIVLTTSRKPAYIKQGAEVAYSTSSNEGTNTEFKEAVMELNVKPHITPTGKILIDIFISKDEIIGYESKGEPIIGKKELKTQATVGHGETVVLGGIYEYENVTGVESVPFLSGLPFIGNMFKKETSRRRKAELLIFISPKIVDTLMP
ncbi:hypothetical protein DC083_03845 [Ignatzschineria ureiclastica]|uniref:Uncharacterized protein n=1 Tax=Ignatzschineria ureiclastica TaxID=472582 RepID=A0A2U2AG32_9GAMM|nr:type IV pilus secretin PilQ [Ignatzschineria ureiclastica]PWD81577.1 hypothetical protein DC083_03845 [Ignatzschineria ureiclastica]GHA01781.1 hypothetical protein GCM10007162_17720 [Ignatzschineria ureiclastica]